MPIEHTLFTQKLAKNPMTSLCHTMTLHVSILCTQGIRGYCEEWKCKKGKCTNCKKKNQYKMDKLWCFGLGFIKLSHNWATWLLIFNLLLAANMKNQFFINGTNFVICGTATHTLSWRALRVHNEEYFFDRFFSPFANSERVIFKFYFRNSTSVNKEGKYCFF